MKPRPTELDAATSAAHRAGQQSARTTADEWRTALTCIEPNKILLRGYPLDEVMGRLTFGEAIYLLLVGEIPTPAMGRLMEALLVSFIDHGATPPSTLAARNTATTGAPLRACVAAGVLGFGRYHGGDIESCMQFLDSGLALVREGVGLRKAAERIVQKCVDADEIAIPGFGHRFHTRDPRAARLFQMALELEVEAEHIQMIRAVEIVARTTTPTSTAGRCRSTSTAPSPPSAATSASRRRSPTRCSSSRACRASRPTPTRNANASSRCARSIRRTTATTAPRRRRLPERRK